MRTARPAILPSLTICRMTAAALRAFSWPTKPCDEARGSKVSKSTPSPRICECAAIKLRPLSSLLSETVWIICYKFSMVILEMALFLTVAILKRVISGRDNQIGRDFMVLLNALLYAQG